MRYRKGVDPDGRRGGEDLERIEGRETVIRIYYVRKSPFSIKGGRRGYILSFRGYWGQ